MSPRDHDLGLTGPARPVRRTTHFSTVGAGPHDGKIENCARCIARAEFSRRYRETRTGSR